MFGKGAGERGFAQERHGADLEKRSEEKKIMDEDQVWTALGRYEDSPATANAAAQIYIDTYLPTRPRIDAELRRCALKIPLYQDGKPIPPESAEDRAARLDKDARERIANRMFSRHSYMNNQDAKYRDKEFVGFSTTLEGELALIKLRLEKRGGNPALMRMAEAMVGEEMGVMEDFLADRVTCEKIVDELLLADAEAKDNSYVRSLGGKGRPESKSQAERFFYRLRKTIPDAMDIALMCGKKDQAQRLLLLAKGLLKEVEMEFERNLLQTPEGKASMARNVHNFPRWLMDDKTKKAMDSIDEALRQADQKVATFKGSLAGGAAAQEGVI